MNMNAQQTTLKGKLLTQELMAGYTSWRVGGAAENFYQPADRADLLVFLADLPAAEPIFFVGLGSNLLVRDGGIKGTVIYLQSTLSTLEIKQSSDAITTVYAEAGVSAAQLARFSVKQGLTGGEFFAGIPGTVGGALAMNAGAFGSETWQYVQQVETVNHKGHVCLRKPKEFAVSYRSVKRPNDEWFIAAYFSFKSDLNIEGQQRIRELLNKRSATQPIGTYSCGSVFRNPPDDHAARLIESCGLKGFRIGGAQVSEKHANFILNENKATAKDIEELIYHVQAMVNKKTGVALQTEVVIVGEPL